MLYEEYLQEAKMSNIEKKSAEIVNDKLSADIKKKEASEIEKALIAAQARVSQIKAQIKSDAKEIRSNKMRKKFEASGMSYEESCEATLQAAQDKLLKLRDLKKRMEVTIKVVGQVDKVDDVGILEYYLFLDAHSVNWRDAEYSRPINLKGKIDIVGNSLKHKDFIDNTKMLDEASIEIKNTLLSIYTKINLYFEKIGLKYHTKEEINSFDTIAKHKADLLDFFDSDEFMNLLNTKEDPTQEPEQEVKTKKEAKPKEDHSKKSVDDLFDEL